jgi:hypothetical protein
MTSTRLDARRGFPSPSLTSRRRPSSIPAGHSTSAMAPVAYGNPIPFTFFCDLLSNIQSVPPIPIVALPSRRASAVPPREARILKLWIEELRRRYDPLPAETGVIVFRLLFPEEGVRRR